MTIQEVIYRHYMREDKKWPNTEEAMMWVATEVGEVFDVLLEMRGGWKRNHPEAHVGTQVALVDEMTDVLFMILVAGMSLDVDLIEILRDRLGGDE